MAHFCMFGGHEGQLTPGQSIYITIFGALEAKRVPVASQIVEWRKSSPQVRRDSWHVLLTLFGSTELKWPSLAEEYLALRDALRAGALRLEDWDQHLASGGVDGPRRVSSFTMFGSFEDDQVPPEEKELDDLSLQRHLGHIPEAAIQTLTLAIGQHGPQRLAAVRQAAAAALAESS